MIHFTTMSDLLYVTLEQAEHGNETMGLILIVLYTIYSLPVHNTVPSNGGTCML